MMSPRELMVLDIEVYHAGGWSKVRDAARWVRVVSRTDLDPYKATVNEAEQIVALYVPDGPSRRTLYRCRRAFLEVA